MRQEGKGKVVEVVGGRGREVGEQGRWGSWAQPCLVGEAWLNRPITQACKNP